jgi:hypothetical protein
MDASSAALQKIKNSLTVKFEILLAVNIKIMVCPFMMLFSPAGSLARHVPTAIKS